MDYTRLFTILLVAVSTVSVSFGQTTVGRSGSTSSNNMANQQNSGTGFGSASNFGQRNQNPNTLSFSPAGNQQPLNPLQTGGSAVRSGSFNQQQGARGGGSRRSSRGGQSGRSGRNRNQRRQTQNRAQYVTRIVFQPLTGSTSRPTGYSPVTALKAIRRSMARLHRSKIRVQFDDAGAVVLTGTVASGRDRRVAEIMAKMESGVRRVQNNLNVSQPPSSASS
jgi:hypothetical protein